MMKKKDIVLSDKTIAEPLAPYQQENYTHETVPTSFIDIKGADFAYRSFGKTGGIPILFLQHFTGTMDNWDPEITNALSKNHHIILLNNKGVSSSGGATPETISEMADDVIAFMGALGLNQADLLGFSLGGFVAQFVAERRPEVVRKIILAGTGPKGGEGISNLANVLAEAFKEAPGQELLYLFFEKTDTSKKAGIEFLKRLEQRKENRDLPASDQTISAQLKAITTFGDDKDLNYTQLKKIKQAVLVVNGNNDIMVPSINSFLLTKNLPDAKLIIWSDAGHGALFQYHKQFVKEVEEFLSGE